MIYLRQVAATTGPAAPASVALVTVDAPWMRRQVDAELDELFPAAARRPPPAADLVVVAGPGRDLADLLGQVAATCQADSWVWRYDIDDGRVVPLLAGEVARWQRRAAVVARTSSWARRHRKRWSMIGRAVSLLG